MCYSLISYASIDVLSSISFGTAFGFMAENVDEWDFVEGNASSSSMLQVITDLEFFRAIFTSPIVQPLFAPKETDEVGMGRVRRFAAEAMSKRFESGKGDKNDMLASFKANGLRMEQCKAESLIQVIAGTDSTSMTLRMGMLYVARNPKSTGNCSKKWTTPSRKVKFPRMESSATLQHANYPIYRQ